MGWIKTPLASMSWSTVVGVISTLILQDHPYIHTDDLTLALETVTPYIQAATLKSWWAYDEDQFASSLVDELRRFECDNPSISRQHVDHHTIPRPQLRIWRIIQGIRKHKTSCTNHSVSIQQVREQIVLFGQYAILSHRWQQPTSQELTFDDVFNLSDPSVQAKEGYKKFLAFQENVKADYGCRYIWVDSVCISEPDRVASIPLMFSWYRHAYVCVVYLPSSSITKDPWRTRGWTLQEPLAARRIKYVAGDWTFLKEDPYYSDRTTSSWKFHVLRESRAGALVLDGHLERSWAGTLVASEATGYIPRADQAPGIFHAMSQRETTKPEDMVYCIYAALDVNIPVHYGEGFDTAFYHLQVECLTRGSNRRLLLWQGGTSSPFNSMLAAHFTSFTKDVADYEEKPEKLGLLSPEGVSPGGDYSDQTYLRNYDSSISFDTKGVMRIMLMLYPNTSYQPHVFALISSAGYSCLGVLLAPSRSGVYRRVEYTEISMGKILFGKEPEWP
ncbi:hypothetical protein AB1N83_005612 [Pleurotus pulmonarius]